MMFICLVFPCFISASIKFGAKNVVEKISFSGSRTLAAPAIVGFETKNEQILFVQLFRIQFTECRSFL